ncbi:hypothetical protein [Roseibium sediminicola]|uniref:Uncharacterized protein n=1 Tax=Roseibium sediminicola TaxID=2933272 RepID=A0ABT0GQU5_9HYPH|nr:hypothetical protein [Roseibium sp. CAU 1639]MCK7611807.1 hypothetical protein [Roseibium sp. CAU 1639]
MKINFEGAFLAISPIIGISLASFSLSSRAKGMVFLDFWERRHRRNPRFPADPEKIGLLFEPGGRSAGREWVAPALPAQEAH